MTLVDVLNLKRELTTLGQSNHLINTAMSVDVMPNLTLDYHRLNVVEEMTSLGYVATNGLTWIQNT